MVTVSLTCSHGRHWRSLCSCNGPLSAMDRTMLCAELRMGWSSWQAAQQCHMRAFDLTMFHGICFPKLECPAHMCTA
jgi:hypothetical protein